MSTRKQHKSSKAGRYGLFQQPEDVSLCESVQRGLKSKGYNQGRFVVDEARSELSEHAVHHFQQMVVDALIDVSIKDSTSGSRPKNCNSFAGIV